jgi:predicted anti-sigma-YlaC factor YlaD
MAHLSHESAAWNLALGVAFIWAASGATRRVGGLVPVIGAFVALLVALSTLDLLAGHVEAGRLVGHVPVIVGLVLLLLHARLGRDGGGTTVTPDDSRFAGADGRDGSRFGFGDEGFGDGGLQPTAHHRAA